MPVTIDQTQAPAVNRLREVLPILPANDRRFATSLVEWFDSHGRLTDRQWPFVQRLLDRVRVVPPIPARDGTPVASYGDINRRAAAASVPPLPAEGLGVVQQWLDRASSNGLRRPALRYPTSAGQLRLSRPSATSAYAGRNVIFVRNGTDYAGRIDGGEFRRANTYIQGTEEALRGVLEAPFQRAVTAGRETGSCCFCGRELTDERSVSAGYGPICAGHYGLPWGEVAAAARDSFTPEGTRVSLRGLPDSPPAPRADVPVDPNGPDDEDRNFL